jgi:hypothetical protein
VLFDGTTAAGLRVGFYLEDDNVTGTPNFMTADGRKLFDAAVAYALGDTAATALFGSPRGPHSAPVPAATLLPFSSSFSFHGRDLLGREINPGDGGRTGPENIRR